VKVQPTPGLAAHTASARRPSWQGADRFGGSFLRVGDGHQRGREYVHRRGDDGRRTFLGVLSHERYLCHAGTILRRVGHLNRRNNKATVDVSVRAGAAEGMTAIT